MRVIHIYDVGDVVRFIKDAVAQHRCGGRHRLYEEYYANCDVGPFWEFMIETYFNGETFRLDGVDSPKDQVAMAILHSMGIPLEYCWDVYCEVFEILTEILAINPVPMGSTDRYSTRAWLGHNGYSLHVDYREYSNEGVHSRPNPYSGNHAGGDWDRGTSPIPRNNSVVASGCGGDLYLRADYRD